MFICNFHFVFNNELAPIVGHYRLRHSRSSFPHESQHREIVFVQLNDPVKATFPYRYTLFRLGISLISDGIVPVKALLLSESQSLAND
jgi:hypothetical protein